MDAGLLFAVLRSRSALRSHDRWSADELRRYQERGLADLRRFAVARSPFYRALHRGLEDAPLQQLPVVTKATLMASFDEVVTDRALRLADLERHIATATVTSLFRGRYRVVVTGGTTGQRGIFLSDPAEWTTVLAAYSRAYAWAGVAVGPTNRSRMAVVSSLSPTHQSSVVGATVASPLVPTLRLAATQPLGEIVAALNDFRPDALVGYASMLRVLAEEQADHRLTIAPRAILSASEVLTTDARERIRASFGVAPTNVYAATETAGIASECRAGHLHRYEDLVIAEIVDEDDQPVAEGEYGAKLLVTVLFSRTQPLIRYELSDRVQRIDGRPGDLPYGVIGGIEGREEEVLTLHGVTVHPNVFHAALGNLPLGGWQVIEVDGALRVLLARPTTTLPDVSSLVRSHLDQIGARDVPISVDVVDAIPRTALGKAPLVRHVAA